MSSPPCVVAPSKRCSSAELVVVVTNHGDGSLLLEQQVGKLPHCDQRCSMDPDGACSCHGGAE